MELKLSWPQIHADISEPDGLANSSDFGLFGFYSRVTNVSVRVEHEYNNGAKGVETVLHSYSE
jgi:hypothetical protein